jgi:hypothetical protein
MGATGVSGGGRVGVTKVLSAATGAGIAAGAGTIAGWAGSGVAAFAPSDLQPCWASIKVMTATWRKTTAVIVKKFLC